MGRLIYPGAVYGIEFDDRTLAHVRVVIMNKLRRSESFMLNLTSPHGTSHSSLWVSSLIPMQFEISSRTSIRLNPRWLDALMVAANSADGFTIVPEPHE